jgi:hypothetical protein
MFWFCHVLAPLVLLSCVISAFALDLSQAGQRVTTSCMRISAILLDPDGVTTFCLQIRAAGGHCAFRPMSLRLSCCVRCLPLSFAFTLVQYYLFPPRLNFSFLVQYYFFPPRLNLSFLVMVLNLLLSCLWSCLFLPLLCLPCLVFVIS